MIRVFFLLFIFFTSISIYGQSLFRGNGQVTFISNAPLEVIEGASQNLDGIVDISSMNFAFKVNMNSFEGFNSPLQKEHFNEHYLETNKYPDATFLGTLLINEDCENGCETEAVCKGKFTIHGVTKIVTIPVKFSMKDTTIKISGKFNINLSDYNIKIPKIVQAKIASEIEITVDVQMLNE